MPTVERVPHAEHHVFVGGPLHGQCWSLRETVQLGPQLEDYAYHWKETVRGSLSGKLAHVWRYCVQDV